MAHLIVGIDLGAREVKFARVEAGFRQARPLGAFAEPVPDGEAPLIERQGEALQRGLARLPPESTLFLAMPGEQLTVRVLDLPFSDPRKIDQVVGYELEGQIVHALADVVFDHSVLATPGMEGTSVLAVAARLDDVGGLLAELGTQSADPRSLFAAPVVYQALFDGMAAGEEGTLPACRLVLDVGHLRTNICVVQGSETIFARTVLRGGAGITAAIARAYQSEETLATEIKHTHGLLRPEDRALATPEQQHLDTVLREALTPLLRDLRQTLASVRSRIRNPIEAVLLTGGGARLRGLPELLHEDLDLPVSLWTGGDSVLLPGVDAPQAPLEGAAPAPEPELRFALASAIAWAGARGRKQIDLRRGPFVYKATFSLLRQKAVHLGVLVAALVISITFYASTSLARLNKQKDELQAQLRSATQELFGEPRLDGREVAKLLRRRFVDEMAPLPKLTAYDLMDEISRRLPPHDKVKLDVLELDIRPKKTFIRGTVDSAAAVDEMVTKLKEIDCFEDIKKGSITEVSGGDKNFTLAIDTKCP
jgi:general secretion pathway protein L